jgi:UDPglucose--hexose-1-phosphate uridylyltransferase
MPELRFNVITKDWVIIARERAKRPDQFALPKKEELPLPQFDPSCPFCPGNESHTEPEIARLGDNKGWRVRVMPNKYPALSAHGERTRSNEGMRISMNGVGLHEVIVDHRRHNMVFALMPPPDIEAVLRMYRQRYEECRKDERLEAIIIFKNHGESAGSSVIHTHSQLAATPVVTFQTRMRLEDAIRFYDQMGKCIFCQTMEEELSAKVRILHESKHFIAFHPYAALSPFHTWIFPRRHTPSFELATDEELVDLASTLKLLLARLYYGLNDPPFNYTIRSIPSRDRNTEYYHWYLSIIPRVTKTAGFEMGSGMYINSALPEESAEFLRNVQFPNHT